MRASSLEIIAGSLEIMRVSSLEKIIFNLFAGKLKMDLSKLGFDLFKTLLLSLGRLENPPFLFINYAFIPSY